MIACVRSVMRRRASSSDMCGRSRPSMSTNTGVAPAWTTTEAVATKLIDGTRTSMPGPTSNTARLNCSAAVPEAEGDRVFHLVEFGEGLLEPPDPIAHREPLIIDNLDQRLLLRFAQERRAELDDWQGRHR